MTLSLTLDDTGTARPHRRFVRKRTAGLVTALTGPAVFVAVVSMFGFSPASLYVVNLWIVYCIASLGFYLVFGLGGRFAFCHAFMIGVGAYTAAWVARSHGFWLCVLAGVVAAAVVAVIVALALRRVTEFAFAIGTLAVSFVGNVVFTEWSGFAGNSGTVANIPAPEVFGTKIVTQEQSLLLLAGGATVALVICAAIATSPMRRQLIASRDDPTVAASLGLPVRRMQGQMFVAGSALAGLSGALLASWQGSISVESFGLDLNVAIFLIVMLGGKDTVWGPLIGSAVYIFLPDQLTSFQRYSVIIFGCLLIVLIVVFPRGLASLATRARVYIGGAVTRRRAARAVQR